MMENTKKPAARTVVRKGKTSAATKVDEKEKPLFEDPVGPERYLSWHDYLPDGDEHRNLNDSDFWHAVAMSKD